MTSMQKSCQFLFLKTNFQGKIPPPLEIAHKTHSF